MPGLDLSTVDKVRLEYLHPSTIKGLTTLLVHHFLRDVVVDHFANDSDRMLPESEETPYYLLRHDYSYQILPPWGTFERAFVLRLFKEYKEVTMKDGATIRLCKINDLLQGSEKMSWLTENPGTPELVGDQSRKAIIYWIISSY